MLSHHRTLRTLGLLAGAALPLMWASNGTVSAGDLEVRTLTYQPEASSEVDVTPVAHRHYGGHFGHRHFGHSHFGHGHFGHGHFGHRHYGGYGGLSISLGYGSPYSYGGYGYSSYRPSYYSSYYAPRYYGYSYYAPRFYGYSYYRPYSGFYYPGSYYGGYGGYVYSAPSFYYGSYGYGSAFCY